MYGAWHFIHGHSGAIEDTATVTEEVRAGWGLSFIQRAGTINYLHYAVPSNAQYGWRVDHLHLKFTAGENAKVSEIHLWDGNLLVWQQAFTFGSGETDVMLPLGLELEINRALGISIKVEAASEGDAHFVIHAVGANFRQIQTGA